MKKRRIQGLCLVFAWLLLMAGPALAVMRNTVFLQETGSGAVVSVRLEDRQDDILSVGLSLQVSFTNGESGQAGVSFAFNGAISSKIMEYRYNETSGILSLYVSGQENLFDGQELTLGTVTVSASGDSAVTARISVVEDSLQVINAAYDHENNEGVSAPEAPEFTVGGQTPGGDEVIPPPETGGGENPGNNGENPGNNGENPGNNGQGPEENENPNGEDPETAGTSAAKPTQGAAPTTAAAEPTQSEPIRGTESGVMPESVGGEETRQPPKETRPPAGNEIGNEGEQASGMDAGRLLLYGGLTLAGAAGLFALVILADRWRRARLRRRHREAAKRRRASATGRETLQHRREPAAERETLQHRRRPAPERTDVKRHRPASGPMTAEKRAAAREAARKHMEQHKGEKQI